MIVLASGFTAFVGFLVLGLGVLVVAVALDRRLGKEKALLLCTGLLLLLTLWQCSPEDVKSRRNVKPETVVPAEEIDIAGLPYEHPPLARADDDRNPFQKHSDTHPLQPISLELPPWLPLAFQLPPTVPGPAPGARRVLRGELPTTAPGDGSSIPEILSATTSDYQPVPDDIYDWIFSSGEKKYVYILSIRRGGQVVREMDEEFADLAFQLTQRAQGWDTWLVEYALIGGEEVAARKLEHTAILKARTGGVTTAPANQFERWWLRRSVDNLFRESLQAHALGDDPSASVSLADLRAAALDMAEIGRSGKEQRKGWRKAVVLLEIALEQARDRATAVGRAEILEELVAAYAALREEEAVLGALSEYARTSPNRPEPWLWLGQLHLRSLGIPEEALAYFEMALSRASRNRDALLGKGDALSQLGRHGEALDVYKRVGNDFDAKVRQAEAHLRLGELQPAAFALAAASAIEPEAPRGLLALGAILYAENDLEKARDAFLQAATSTGERALDYRAQACYDLGLTCWRLGQTDAARASFEACESALRHGSMPQRSPDEAVSPAFGRALLALSAGNDAALREGLLEARKEAPRVAYHEMLTGMIASRAEDHGGAIRAFERALGLTIMYPELDGWLAKTRLALGQGALRAFTPLEEASADFEAAVAYAARASKSEAAADGRAYSALAREAWVRLGAMHLQERERLEDAREVTRKILRKVDREQPTALSIQGYCDYNLAKFGIGPFGEDVTDPYDACIRDFQQVLNKVAVDDESPAKVWRDYSADALQNVKHWRGLEEKIVSFDDDTFKEEFKLTESSGVRAHAAGGVVTLDDAADSDGNLDDPTFVATNRELFEVGSFEEIRMKIKIPSRDDGGTATNTITFGVQVERATGRGGRRSRFAGIGIFYDRGKIALRIGGGQLERWKEGAIVRLAPEIEWPSDDWVDLRITRTNAREGHFELWLDDPNDSEPGLKLLEEGEFVSGFKGLTSTKADLWIGGFSTQAQQWLVQVKDIVVIRRKK